MRKKQSASRDRPKVKSLRGFIDLSRRVMYLANRPIPRVEFLEGLSELLLQFSDCDSLEIVALGEVEYHLLATARPEPEFSFGPLTAEKRAGVSGLPKGGDGHTLRQLVLEELCGAIDSSASCFTAYGSFWTSDIRQTVNRYPEVEAASVAINPDTISMALVPFAIDEANFGVLRLECAARGLFSHEKIEAFEAVAETIGLAIAQRRGQAALRERVKELSCLYGIAMAIESAGEDVDLGLDQILSLLPPAWQYPEIAVSRIVFDECVHGAPNSIPVLALQSANIIVDGVHRGTVEVGYVEAVKHALTGPFLEEEEHLIQAVAREVGDYVARCEVAAESGRLEEQLHHADRLATIGQLVAGVAHEINEPLSSILGFAQLAQKDSDVTDSTKQDLGRIIASCLQAREVVNQLKLFARQTPIEKNWMSVDEIVAEAISFVHGRCVSQGVEVTHMTAGDAHMVEADPVRLKQVLVNLAVNAIQAMPDGGRLIVTTRATEGAAIIEVSDTGTGMSEEVRRRVFNPFFTTKDVGEGTGLGLSVVQGIVDAHGGEIDVESVLHKGSTFTVRLPVQEPANGVGRDHAQT